MTRSSSLTLAERYPQGVKLRREIARQNHGSEQLIVIPWRFLAAGDRTRLPI